MPYLLEMKNITKTFGSVKAIDNVSLRLNAGEIVSLCGENGSGKSTLMKVLCGIYPMAPTKAKLFCGRRDSGESHPRYRTQRYRHHSPGIGPGERIDRAGKYLPG